MPCLHNCVRAQKQPAKSEVSQHGWAEMIFYLLSKTLNLSFSWVVQIWLVPKPLMFLKLENVLLVGHFFEQVIFYHEIIFFSIHFLSDYTIFSLSIFSSILLTEKSNDRQTVFPHFVPKESLPRFYLSNFLWVQSHCHSFSLVLITQECHEDIQKNFL